MARINFIKRLCRAVIALEWLFLALILPAVLFPSPERAVALLLIPLLWFVRWLAYDYFLPPTPLNGVLLLLLTMLLVSLYATFDLLFSLSKITGLLFGVAVFFAAVDFTGRSYRHLWGAVLAFLTTGVAIAALGALGARWSSIKIPGIDIVLARLPRGVISLPGAESGFSPNQIAGVLLWLLPLALALLTAVVFHPRKLWPELRWWGWLAALIISGGATLLMGSVFILTQSRGGLIGLAFALLIMALITFLSNRRLALIALLSLFIGVGVINYAIDRERLWTLVGERAAESRIRSWDDTVESFEGRIQIWSRAIEGVKDFAWTGMGMGTFRHNVILLYPFFHSRAESDIAHAHNHLLQTALDLGIPGLIAYLAVWLGAIVLLWQTWRTAPTAVMSALVIGFAGSLAGYFIYGLTDTVALGARPGFVFWFLIGLIAGLHRLIQPPTPSMADNGTMATNGSLNQINNY